ncbi:MFS transporter [Gallibacterium salpingitidis]|uniref:MFS transporter n=1 Tax=Gallibacterium salpingitidis TaxID=505341 RepID=UPI000825DB64|nr:MFS transporter [Gallibacterium salpingitidis]WKS99564.1 MFS transporter [Gallibacterium salpingitidis]
MNATQVLSGSEDTEFKRQLTRAKIGAAIGTSLDQMEMTLFSLASALCFGQVFFPNTDPKIALISAFGIYGVGFLVRPIGGVIFSHLGEIYGRKWVLSMTVMLMGLATFCIGLIPSYSAIGIWAPILLVLCRCVQGAAVGAEYTSGTTYLTEIAPIGKRGITASFVWAGASAGTVVGGLVWTVVLTSLSREDLTAWGWRIPFLLTIFVTMFAIWMRLKLHESPVFLDKQKEFKERAKRAAPIVEAWQKSKKNMLRIFGFTFPCVGHSFMYQAFLGGYIVNYVRADGGPIFSTATAIGATIGIIGGLFGGWLSDKIGRRKAGLIYAVIMCIFPILAFTMVNTGSPILIGLVMVFCFWFPAEGAMGVQSPQLPEIFGSRYRYSALTLAREIGAIGGGLVPMLASIILAYLGGWVAVAIFMSLLMLINVYTTYVTIETKDRDLYDERDAM